MSQTSCPAILAYGQCIPEASCKYFMKIPREYQCRFVEQTPDCLDDSAYIQYMHVFACYLNNYDVQVYTWISIVLLALVIIFITLGILADGFFAPSLCAIANILEMSDHLAGVTLVAFGNSFIDIVTSIIGASYLGPEIVICQQFGSGMFTICMNASCILLIQEIYAIAVPFIRDVLCYMVGIIWLLWASESDSLELYETLILIGLYLVYVLLVTFESFWRRFEAKRKAPEVEQLVKNEDSLQEKTIRPSKELKSKGKKKHRCSIFPKMRAVIPSQSTAQSRRSLSTINLPSRKPTQVTDSIILPPQSDPRARISINPSSIANRYIEAQRLSVLRHLGLYDIASTESQKNEKAWALIVDGETVYEKPSDMWADFVEEMRPVNRNEWKKASTYGKFNLAVSAPLIMIFKLFIPVVDHGALNNGWCKLLNMIHCVSGPMVCIFIFEVTDLSPLVYTIIIVCTFVAGCVLAYLVWATSSVNAPPFYHPAFAIAGFLISMLVIYVVAHEMVFLIDVLGSVLQISVPVLAMTLIVWGSSVGDLVTNVALTRAGYARMAWAACFGSIIMSLLLGTGIAFTILVETKGHDHSVHFTPRNRGIIANCFLYLTLSLVSCLIIVPSMKFQCRKSFAMYMIVLYVMFLIFLVLCEFDTVHAIRTEEKIPVDRSIVYK